MSLALDLTGRLAVVTGGTRGVGAGIARAFLQAGAEVVVCARRPPDTPVEAAGRRAHFRPSTCATRPPSAPSSRDSPPNTDGWTAW